ncbi:MAG: TonB-dependent receptor [Caldithrix sp.]|nr:TonB-dependent receptor [Caldithrix sp.]
MRVAYNTGFKAPQTFDEDLHIESLGGNQRVVRNASDLEPERSQSLSGGLEYEGYVGDHALLAGATVFYTRLSGTFTQVKLAEQTDDLVLWQRSNGGGAYLYGIEADFGFKPTRASEIRLGITYKQSAYNTAQEVFANVFSDQFLRTPDVYGYLRASLDVTESFNLFSAAKYTGTMHVPNETDATIVKTSDTFLVLDTGLQWQFPFTTSFDGNLAFGVKNITNAYQNDLQRGMDRDPAYVYGPQLPRRIYGSLEISF